MFPYKLGSEGGDLEIDETDNAAGAPKSVVVDNVFDWGNDRAPRTSWRNTIIYEAHVKGFTMRHPDVPEQLRGTYAGLASRAAIAHFKKLGVTAVELMPVHEMVDDNYLTDRGLRNYWGYNTLSYFAPAGSFTRSHGGLRSASGSRLNLLGRIPSLTARVPCGLVNLLPGNGRGVLDSVMGVPEWHADAKDRRRIRSL